LQSKSKSRNSDSERFFLIPQTPTHQTSTQKPLIKSLLDCSLPHQTLIRGPLIKCLLDCSIPHQTSTQGLLIKSLFDCSLPHQNRELLIKSLLDCSLPHQTLTRGPLVKTYLTLKTLSLTFIFCEVRRINIQVISKAFNAI